MLDYSTKEFVRSFTYSNLKEDRRITKEELILGRKYIKFGVACATTAVANLWKVYDPSVERFKYVYLVGVARQHPSDINVKYRDGVEIAQTNAMTNPVMTLIYDQPIEFERIEFIMSCYVDGLPEQLVKTSKEIEYMEFMRTNCIDEIDYYELH